MRTWATLFTAFLLLAGGCVSVNPSVVRPASYLGQHTNPAGIYEPGGGAALLPVFDVRVEPMTRMMLINFAGDPLYEAIELQTYAAQNGEESSVVLLARRDTAVDVYISPNHRLDEVGRRALEALVSPRTVTIQEAQFAYRLEVTANGLETGVLLGEREGREVSLEIVETAGQPKPSSLLAPIGSISEAPEAFPLIYLDEFGLVRRRGTSIRVAIDGQERTPEKLTWLIRPPAYYSRYSTRVVVAQWNERREALLEPVPVAPGAAEVQADDLTWRLRWNGSYPEVEAVVARRERDAVTFLFSPALPDLARLRAGAAVAGRFVVNVNEVEGILAGEYRIERSGNGVRLELQPRRAWQPPGMKGGPWVASYRYEADLDLSGPRPQLRSEWRRLGQ